MLRCLAASVIALACTGCSVGVGYTYDEHDHHHHHHQHYAVDFRAVVVGGHHAPSASIECLCEEELELVLSLRNDGPRADAYTAADGRTQRFIAYDAWGHLVWDSWYWQPSGVTRTWSLPLGATISLSERWALVDNDGFALPPGIYTVHAWFGGSLAGGELPASPSPVVVEILPDGVG